MRMKPQPRRRETRWGCSQSRPLHEGAAPGKWPLPSKGRGQRSRHCITHRHGRAGRAAGPPRGTGRPATRTPLAPRAERGRGRGSRAASLKRAPGPAGSEVTPRCPSLGPHTQMTSLFCAGPSSRPSAAFPGCSTQARRESGNSWTDAVCGPQDLKNTVE